MNAINKLSAVEAAARIAAEKLKSEALVAACLERIGQREKDGLTLLCAEWVQRALT